MFSLALFIGVALLSYAVGYYVGKSIAESKRR